MKRIVLVLFLFAFSTAYSFEKSEWKVLGDTYELRVPSGYSENKFYSLIVGLHGSTSNPADIVKVFENFVDTYQFILYCPKSGSESWRMDGEINDMNVILNNIKALENKYKIKKDKILLAGFSSGASFSYVVGLTHPSVFKGIIAMSGYLNPKTLEYVQIKKLKKMKVAISHGSADEVSSVTNGRNSYSALKTAGLKTLYREAKDVKHVYPPKEIIKELLDFTLKTEQ